ncbi:MAG: hypothetical protein AAB131_03045 [Actinomycetota bacterium]
MDLFDAVVPSQLPAEPIPTQWFSSPAIVNFELFGEVAAAISRLDDASDTVLLALLMLDDELTTPVILLGLRRLLFLCRGRDRDLLNDLTTEVAIVIGEMRRIRPTTTNRRLGYVIVDRARDRQRAALRRQSSSPIFDPKVFAETVADERPNLDDTVAVRLRLQALRAQVEACGDPALTRSWNTLLELAETPRTSQADRDRWKYVRRRLLQHLGPEHAA